MTSEHLSRYWQKAGQLFGFTVEAPYQVILPGGQVVTFAARLPDFGALHGMLLSDDFDAFAAHEGALIAAGYGYSVLSASPNSTPELADIVDVLQDWGWSASSTCPDWLSEA